MKVNLDAIPKNKMITDNPDMPVQKAKKIPKNRDTERLDELEELLKVQTKLIEKLLKDKSS